MSNNLFGRSWKVQVDTLDVSNLDLEFRVKRDLKQTPNSCLLSIWNLSKDHRSQLLKRNRPNDQTKLVGVPVKIEAGYINNTSVIFTGDLSEVSSVLDDTDWKTNLSSEDGGRALREARINQSFGKGMPISQVVTQIINEMKVGVGNALKEVSNKVLGKSVGETTVHTLTVSGSASKHFDRIMQSAGLTWSIQNGVLQVLGPNGSLEQEAVLISPSTGLIGSPESSIDSTVTQGNAAAGSTSTHPGVIKMKTLLIPGLVPGRKITLQSAAFNGGYVITEVEYIGQSWSNQWECNLIARIY